MKARLLTACLLITTGLHAQGSVPAGTILPVRLNSSINTKKIHAPKTVTARVMQDVPLSSGGKIRAGSKVIGHVLEAGPATQGGASLAIRFDTLEVKKQQISITTNLRALASRLEVDEAQIPAYGPDRGTPSQSWTTQQVGGDIVYRGGGPVTSGSRVVGEPAVNGVLVHVDSQAGTPCDGDVSDDNLPQALWVFSADACGIYGYRKLTIVHAGRSDPVGEIRFATSGKSILLRGGSGLLLNVR